MAAEAGREIEIFTEAAQLSAEQRVAFLDRSCVGDDKLRQKLEALLKVNDRAGEFLEQPPAAIDGGRANAVSVGEKPGDIVGKYKLLQQIGEGGCGIVFMAEQAEPVHRRVALKVIKPGMDTKSVIARFEAERQALAMMDHPSIARVLDAGATDSGRPYFVMELVKGIKINDYCDEHSVPTRSRLELYMQVCDAIQHAHQRGIIHRDIKPSNILVTTLPDGKPLTKVIDFGIAKATTGLRLTDKTIFTSFEMLIGTPAYMSPEQAALTSAEVDTRTDIYSLGVLLYELLTGTTPFDTRELLKAGIDEVRRVIRDEEPVRPSTRLSTMAGADTVSFSKHHATEVPKLIREMRGDLDWIAMKALEKDRARRYATANGLAMDINRYLSGDAVLARPPSTLYKARKLVVRNKVLCTSLATVFALLAGGLAVTTRLLIVEKQRREQAQHQEEVYRLEGLALAQWTQGSAAEAVSNFRQAFGERWKFLGGQPPYVATATVFLQLHEKENRTDEAETILLADFPKAELLAAPGYANLFGEFAVRRARKGRWKEATNDLANLVKAEPEFSNGYHALAPVLVACQDVPAYRRLCQQIVAHFGASHDAGVADQMAKDCLILPNSGADLKAVGALADVAVTRGTNHSSYSLFKCCKALAEYRQGHFAEAARWAASAAQHPFPYSKAEGYAVLAMAQFNLGQTNEARAALQDCAHVIESFPKLSSGDLGGDWRDWIIAHALQFEGTELIDGEGSPASAVLLSR